MAAINPNAGIAGFVKSWVAVFLCMGLIFSASSIPGKDIPSLFNFQAVLFHFLVYLMLIFFFCRALRNTFKGFTRLGIILLGVLFGVIFGLIDEFHQSFVPLRSVSLSDIVIDGIGSLVGSLMYR